MRISAKERDRILKLRSSGDDAILDPITIGELVMTVEANEKKINPQVVKKALNELIKRRVKDAYTTFKKEEKRIMKEFE